MMKEKRTCKKVFIISAIIVIAILICVGFASGILKGWFANSQKTEEKLYNLKETTFAQHDNIEKIISLANFSPYEIHSFEIRKNYDKCIDIKFMVEDRSMHRRIDDNSLRKLSAVVLALIPEADGVGCYVFDKYSEDINNLETSFNGAYTPRNDLYTIPNFERFTGEYIKNSTLNLENFIEYYNTASEIISEYELSDYLKQKYDFIGNDYEIVVNSQIGAEFLVDKKFLESEEARSISQIFKIDLAQYEGDILNIQQTDIRNFKTNEDKKHTDLIYSEGDKTLVISQQIIESHIKDDKIKDIIQVLMNNADGKKRK